MPNKAVSTYNQRMASPQPAGIKFKIWPTIIAVVAILIIGAVIIYLDRAQVAKLSTDADFRLILTALFSPPWLTSWVRQAFVAVLRLFDVHMEWPYLMRVAWLSIIQHNLIALPAALVVSRAIARRAAASATTAPWAPACCWSISRTWPYSRLIPFSMFFLAVTGNFSSGGLTVLLAVAVIVAVGVITSGLVYFNRRTRAPVMDTVVRLWRRYFHRDVSASVKRFEEALDGGLARLGKRKKTAFVLVALVFGDVAATIITLWLCFAALGIDIAPGVLVASFNLGVTLAVVPFVPTQLGFQDASMAAILAIFGVPFSYGILGAILFRAMFYFLPFVISAPLYVHVLRETSRRASCILQPEKSPVQAG